MSKILIIAENNDSQDSIEVLLKGVGYDTFFTDNENNAFELTNAITPDIAIVDTSCKGINVSTVCRKLKLQSQTNDIQIILLTSSDSAPEELLVGADGYITKPLNINILIATVNAHLRIKKLLDILYTNNSELAKSLYQLNVLYNTSSQLAGTLDKSKLINIMNIGFEKSLNYSLCCAFIINDPENATLMINSIYPPAEELIQALKLRSMLGYKNLFEDKNLPFNISINNIKVEIHYREEGKTLGLNVLEYDGLFAPINTSDRFFGTVEILRENEYTGEDATCFQTVVKQVSLPLESAILYDEIKQTNIKLEKLEKMKSEFISIVSHELRTPLTAVKNSLDIILSGKTGVVTPQQNNFLNMAKRNLDRLSGIINDLLDLSKIEAGKMEYRFEPFNIGESLDFVKNTYGSLADKKNIDLRVNYNKELPLVYGDIRKIEQILTNLVSNAVKFTSDKGNISISASLIHSSELDYSFEGEYIKISVEDTGIGIAKDDIPKVFDKFQQIESTLSRDVGGTGLGLPIAKELVEAHRGHIWLESQPQEGSIFSFILPVVQNKARFMLDLDRFIQSAKYNHLGFSLIVSEKMTLSSDIIKADNTCFFKDDHLSYAAVPGYKNTDAVSLIDNLKADNIGKFAFSVYPQDAITSEELIDIAEKRISSRVE
ncbi:MAG: hybrid sensor histidine kinase/response regulator [bacterium]